MCPPGSPRNRNSCRCFSARGPSLPTRHSSQPAMVSGSGCLPVTDLGEGCRLTVVWRVAFRILKSRRPRPLALCLKRSTRHLWESTSRMTGWDTSGVVSSRASRPIRSSRRPVRGGASTATIAACGRRRRTSLTARRLRPCRGARPWRHDSPLGTIVRQAHLIDVGLRVLPSGSSLRAGTVGGEVSPERERRIMNAPTPRARRRRRDTPAGPNPAASSARSKRSGGFRAPLLRFCQTGRSRQSAPGRPCDAVRMSVLVGRDRLPSAARTIDPSQVRSAHSD
jgi:hypothetical protein